MINIAFAGHVISKFPYHKEYEQIKGKQFKFSMKKIKSKGSTKYINFLILSSSAMHFPTRSGNNGKQSRRIKLEGQLRFSILTFNFVFMFSNFFYCFPLYALLKDHISYTILLRVYGILFPIQTFGRFSLDSAQNILFCGFWFLCFANFCLLRSF